MVFSWLKKKWDANKLFKAVKKGQSERVTELLDRGAPVNAKAGGNYTPLHAAAWLWSPMKARRKSWSFYSRQRERTSDCCYRVAG